MKKLRFPVLLALCLSLMSVSLQARDKTDTVEDVMRAGQKALPELDNKLRELKERANQADDTARKSLEKQIEALQKFRPMVSRMGRDRAFATKILEFALKNDTRGLSGFLQVDTPGARLEVREIKDFSFLAFLEVGNSKHEVCICSNACCGQGSYYFRFGQY